MRFCARTFLTRTIFGAASDSAALLLQYFKSSRPAFIHLALQDNRRLELLGPLSCSASSVRTNIISIATASRRLLYHMYLGSSRITQPMFSASAKRQMELDLGVICPSQLFSALWTNGPFEIEKRVLPSIFQHMHIYSHPEYILVNWSDSCCYDPVLVFYQQ